MLELSSKQTLSSTVRRVSQFCAVALLCVVPCAFPQSRPGYGTKGNNDVSVILDDLKSVGAQRQATSGGLISSTEGLSSLSPSAKSRLISYSPQGDLSKKKVKVPEANAAFSWLIDLGGLAGLVFFARKRVQS